MKLLTLLFLTCNCAIAQSGGSNSSSPWTARANKTLGLDGEIRIEGSDGHYFGFHAQNTAAGNIVVGLPNSAPTAGTCLGYSSVLQLDWITCAAGASYDPTLGVLMTTNTNAGVTGTGNGAHISWDPTNHWIDIQSWFGGSISSVHFNASQVVISVLNLNSCLGTGCFTNGFNINNQTGNDATSVILDGGHQYWDTTNHLFKINSIFSSAFAPIVLNASHVDAANFHGNILLNTTPTLCPAGQYSRGPDVNVNGTGCTLAATGSVTSVTLASTYLNLTGTNPITGSGTINVNLPTPIAAGGCGNSLSSCVLSFNAQGIITATGSAPILDPGLGLLMTNSTNTGVTGTGDGLHIYWNTGTHHGSIQPWFSGTTTTLDINGALTSSTHFLNIAPNLCPVGQYSRGVDQNIGGTGCTLAASSGVDPTLGLIGVNDTNANTTGTTTGLHIFYDPGASLSHINSYLSGSNTGLSISASVLNILSTTNTFSVLPSVDNLYTFGNSSVRYSDIRSVLGHFGVNPLDIPTGTTLQMANTGLSIMVQDAYNGNIAAYIMRAANAGPSALTSNYTVGVIGARGFDGSAWVTSTNASMAMTTTQAWNSGAHGMKLVFNTTALNQTSAAQRLQIDESGLTVAAMSSFSSHAVCVTAAGLIYAAAGFTCP